MRPQPEPEAPSGAAFLRIMAMPRDANPNGEIFGGWTISHMDLAGAACAGERAQGRIATVGVDCFRFLSPVAVGEEVSCYCAVIGEGRSSLTLQIEAWARTQGSKGCRVVAIGLFTYVAMNSEGRPRKIEVSDGS